MPGAYRYSASLDKAYKDDDVASHQRLSIDLGNGDPKRTCSMDSLDSISSSACSIAGSSTSSGGDGLHSRQVSADSTSSPTNFSSTTHPSSTPFTNSRTPPKSTTKVSYNPHQFIKAGPSTLHKTANEQIKVVKEVVKTFRSPVKEDEEGWQLNLDGWKSRRRGRSMKTIKRVDEMQKLETVEDVTSEIPSRRKNKTFSEMCQDKGRRPSYNLSLYTSMTEEESNDEISKEIHQEKQHSPSKSENDIIKKDSDNKFDAGNDSDHLSDSSNKDKDDGYSSKDECNRTEADEQSDTPVNEDQITTTADDNSVTEVIVREVETSYTSSVRNSYHNDENDDIFVVGNSVVRPTDDCYALTAFNEYDEDVSSTTDEELMNTTEKLPEKNDKVSMPKVDAPNVPEQINDSNSVIKTVVLKLKPNSDVRDFGFTFKGGYETGTNIVVDSITQNGAAEKSGVTIGDNIVTINGESTGNRHHSAIVFAIKQAVYTGQLELGINRNPGSENGSIVNGEPDATSLPKKRSVKAFGEKRAVFLGKEKDEKEAERQLPARDKVLQKKSMFENVRLRESPKRAVDVGVRKSLKERVASFENVNEESFMKSVCRPSENLKAAPPVLPKPSVQRTSDYDHHQDVCWDIESVLSQPDLVETSVDLSGSSSSSSSSDEQKSDDDDRHDLDDEMVVKEEITEEMQRLSNQHLLRAAPAAEESTPETQIRQETIVEPCSDRKHDADPLVDDEPPVIRQENTAFRADELDRSELQCGESEEVRIEREHRNVGFKSDEIDKLFKQQPEVDPGDSEEVLLQCERRNVGFRVDQLDRLFGRSAPNCESPDSMHEAEHPEHFDDGTNDSIEDISDALDEALAAFDDVDPPPPNDETEQLITKTVKPEEDVVQYAIDKMDVNIIYDSDCVDENKNSNQSSDTKDYNFLEDPDFVIDDNFDRPRSFAEPPKEKPPPPPIDLDSSPEQNMPTMNRINSTKRIKKEIWKRRSNFLGLSTPKDDTIEFEMTLKPRRQMDDLLRSELEMEKNLPSPTLSSDYSEPCYESAAVEVSSSEQSEQKGDDVSLDGDDDDEEERIKRLEDERIGMQEARRRAEEERLIRERVEQIRKQQEMMFGIEKERLKRENDEMMKARNGYQIDDGLATESKSVQSSTTVNSYKDPKTRPRAPPPTFSKSEHVRAESRRSVSPEERERCEVIRRSRRPASGDFGRFDLYASDSSCQAAVPKQPLSRHSLQSLSAVPKASFQNSDSHWMRRDVHAAKRRSDVPRRDTCSHWLYQEAEMRRIADRSERIKNERPIGNALAYSKSDTNINKHGANVVDYIPDTVIDTLNYRVNRMHEYNKTSSGNGRDPGGDKYPSTEQNGQYVDANDSRQLYYNRNLSTSVPSGVNNYADSSPESEHLACLRERQLNNNNRNLICAVDNSKQTNKTTNAASSCPAVMQDNILSVSGKKKCSNCGEELGRGAAMIIESLQLFYHIKCFRCRVCQVQLGNGSCGADVRVRNHKLHCRNCYSNDEAGLKFSKV